jgi:hypothetical protein
MDWDPAKKSLRVRYFKGPYNDEIITRAFPIEGRQQGVASKAVTSGMLQYRNSMDRELREQGEQRLQAMVSIPVIENAGQLSSSFIAVINIDSALKEVLPDPESREAEMIRDRGRRLVEYIRRVNALKTEVEKSAVA